MSIEAPSKGAEDVIDGDLRFRGSRSMAQRQRRRHQQQRVAHRFKIMTMATVMTTSPVHNLDLVGCRCSCDRIGVSMESFSPSHGRIDRNPLANLAMVPATPRTPGTLPPCPGDSRSR